MTNRQLEKFQAHYDYLYQQMQYPYPGMTELPYKRHGPFDTVIRNGLEHILDPNGKIWPWHWKNKGDKTGDDDDDDDHGHECKRKTGKYCGKCIDCTMYCERCGGTGGHCSCTDSSDDDSN